MSASLKVFLVGIVALWFGLSSLYRAHRRQEETSHFARNSVVVDGTVTDQFQISKSTIKKWHKPTLVAFDVVTSFKLPNGTQTQKAFRRTSSLQPPADGGPIMVKVTYLPDDPYNSARLLDSTPGVSAGSLFDNSNSTEILALLGGLGCISVACYRERELLKKYFRRPA